MSPGGASPAKASTVDRVNTTVLSILALVLLGIGAYGLARGYGAFGDDRRTASVLSDDVRDFVSRNTNWFWPVAAAASLLVAWLGLRWLMAQIHRPAVSRLRVQADGPGATEVVASGAAAALAADIGAYPGVRGVRAHMADAHPSPEVDITLDVDDDADLADLRRRVDEHALARFKSALDLPELPTRVHLRLAGEAHRSVH